MLATARLTGQTTGAALVALLFHIDPENGCHIALLLAGGFALAGSVVSFSRLSLALPQALAYALFPEGISKAEFRRCGMS